MQATDLKVLAEALAAHRNWSLTTIGAYAANDGKFFSRVAAGGGCTLKTASAVLNWFAQNWPADLEWPRAVPRPPIPQKGAA